MATMDIVYVEAHVCNEDKNLLCSLEGLITLYVCELCLYSGIELRILFLETEVAGVKIPLPRKFIAVPPSDIPKIAKSCKWPVIVTGNTVVAGLCSVLRQIIKKCQKEKLLKLLGFRQSCLVSCNETSIWTKFCEIDCVNTVNEFLANQKKFINDTDMTFPIDLCRFEQHMGQPIKIHNVYKLARAKLRDKSIKSSTPIEDLQLDHEFTEGPFITLSDIILYICFHIIFNIYGLELIEKHFPLSYKWFNRMRNQSLPEISCVILTKFLLSHSQCKIRRAEVVPNSLFISGPKTRPQNRPYTKQCEIEKSMNLVNSLMPDLENEQMFVHNYSFDWSKVPVEINPTGGALPAKRAVRKSEQLESLLKPVLQLAQPNYTIVDFCSGSGHLGLLIAAMLPKCHIILVENKYLSLQRAKERVEKLHLQNVTLLQCNMDYFCSQFDIGVSLHACGVATDLVMQSCIENKAHFICCPCCYGSVHNCYHLEYPRSKIFRNSDLRYRDYLNLVHAADQTHDSDNVKTKQGFICMDIVDTDRKFYAEQFEYRVYMGKLQPVTCTPKNNLLIGICKYKNK